MIGYIIWGLGFAMVLEGLALALAPRLIEHVLEALKTTRLSQRAMFGLVYAGVGAVLLWLGQTWI
jgi:uncharacterized protein YjeT (DUF2065 family)